MLSREKPASPVSKLSHAGTVGVFTPSEPLTIKRRQRVEHGVQLLKQAGFDVKFGSHFEKSTYYTAGEPEERAADFHDLLADDRVDVVMAAWGGKSSAQLLPYLNYDLIASMRKPICAFSDGCVFLNAITGHCGQVTFYGPNVVGKLDESDFWNLSQLKGIDFGRESVIINPSPNFTSIVPGSAEGVLFGGNLSTYILGLLGNNYEPQIGEGIFFWESGKKTAQELDVLLTSLRLSKISGAIRGMVIGDITIVDDPDWGIRSLADIVVSVFERKFPILHAPIFGHRKLPNPALPIGCIAHLDASSGQLTLLSDPVK